MSNLLDDARQYLSAQLGGHDMSDLPEDSVRGCIEKLYSGGWVAYQQDYLRFHRSQQKVLEEFSPVKQKIYVEHMTGQRIKEHDELISLDKSDLEVKIVLKRAIVQYGSRRDKVTGERVELWVFRRTSTNQMWPKPQFIEVETTAQAELVRFGTVNTPEREADKREQAETCYRPGTERTPLQGWVARLGVSHEQAHESETFQKPAAKKGGK